MNTTDLTIIILNLNTKDLLCDCLNSIQNSGIIKSFYSLEIIVCDNGSTDGSLEMVKTEFPLVIVVNNGSNLGFSKGNNRGILQSTGRYVLFLNSDTRVGNETLTKMIEFMDSDPRMGAAGCFIELFDGKMDINCHRGFPTPLNSIFHFSGISKVFPRSRFFSGYYLGDKDLTTIHEVDSLEGAFMMVRREAAKSVSVEKDKWWDEDYFFNAEDIDFCFRLKKAGWKIMYYPKVKITHYKGATHGLKNPGIALLPSGERERLVKSTTDSMKIFYEKHYKKVYPFFINWLVLRAIDFLEKIRVKEGGTAKL